MTQFKSYTLNVKFSNSQINKLKFGIKNNTEVTLKILSIVISDIIMKITFHIICY